MDLELKVLRLDCQHGVVASSESGAKGLHRGADNICSDAW